MSVFSPVPYGIERNWILDNGRTLGPLEALEGGKRTEGFNLLEQHKKQEVFIQTADEPLLRRLHSDR